MGGCGEALGRAAAAARRWRLWHRRRGLWLVFVVGGVVFFCGFCGGGLPLGVLGSRADRAAPPAPGGQGQGQAVPLRLLGAAAQPERPGEGGAGGRGVAGAPRRRRRLLEKERLPSHSRRLRRRCLRRRHRAPEAHPAPLRRRQARRDAPRWPNSDRGAAVEGLDGLGRRRRGRRRRRRRRSKERFRR